jgi:hypothetical protein
MILRGALVAGKPGSGPRPQAFDLPKPPRIGYNAAREPDLAAALVCPGQGRCAGANREPPMLGPVAIAWKVVPKCLTLLALLERCAKS